MTDATGILNRELQEIQRLIDAERQKVLQKESEIQRKEQELKELQDLRDHPPTGILGFFFTPPSDWGQMKPLELKVRSLRASHDADTKCLAELQDGFAQLAVPSDLDTKQWDFEASDAKIRELQEQFIFELGNCNPTSPGLDSFLQNTTETAQSLAGAVPDIHPQQVEALKNAMAPAQKAQQDALRLLGGFFTGAAELLGERGHLFAAVKAYKRGLELKFLQHNREELVPSYQQQMKCLDPIDLSVQLQRRKRQLTQTPSVCPETVKGFTGRIPLYNAFRGQRNFLEDLILYIETIQSQPPTTKQDPRQTIEKKMAEVRQHFARAREKLTGGKPETDWSPEEREDVARLDALRDDKLRQLMEEWAKFV